MTNLMNRREFIKQTGSGATAIAISGLECSHQTNKSGTPNIVLLFADDLGYGDLTCYGHPTIRTPNLDRMAQEGVRLTSFYVAAPSCTPSRAALMTGRYPIRCGLPNVLGPESTNGLPDSEITLAQALKAKGYRTMAIGKWHLGHAKNEYMPTARGFDSYFGLLYSNDMIPPWVQTDKPLQLYRNTTPIEHPVDQTTLTRRYTEEAVKFIEASNGQPFFLYVPYSMPHLPIFASDDFKGKSRAGLYGDVIEEIDWSAGQILDTLQQEGIDKNTLVIFTSDNGPWCNMPPRMLQQGNEKWHAGTPGLLRGAKATTYEGGMRVPCIIRWAGQIPGGQISADMATTMDLFTTILELAGAEVLQDRPIDGNNIISFLKGEQPSPTKEFFYFRGTHLEAVREGKWKYRRTNEAQADSRPGLPPKPELYDLEVDPAEKWNVADQHLDIVARLDKKLLDFATELGAEVAE